MPPLCNFGPNTICVPHKDYNNCPFGWCSILALGNFNPKREGQTIPWEAGHIAEFPPGSMILILSALIPHWNLFIQPQECCCSFTQFTPGNIFHFVENGFQTDANLCESDPKRHKVEMEKRSVRWKEKMKLFYMKEQLWRRHLVDQALHTLLV